MSERGGYPKGLTELPWARWWHRGLWATPSCSCCCCCFRVVPLRPRPVGSDQRGLGRKTWGGRSPRGNGQGVPPSNGDAGPRSPGPSLPGPKLMKIDEIRWKSMIYIEKAMNIYDFRWKSKKIGDFRGKRWFCTKKTSFWRILIRFCVITYLRT